MYLVDTNEDLTQYTLSTPWNPSTKGVATSVLYISSALDEDTVAPNPSYVDIDASGQRMYIIGASRYIHEFWLSTPWDSSTAQYTGRRNHSVDTVTGIFFDKVNADKFFTLSTSVVKTYIRQT